MGALWPLWARTSPVGMLLATLQVAALIPPMVSAKEWAAEMGWATMGLWLVEVVFIGATALD